MAIKNKSRQKCVFFDRDGIVNESPGEGKYVTRWSAFHLVPEFPACLRIVTDMGYRAVIVTNQRCVALGLMTRAELEDIHRRLKRLLFRDYGLKLLDVVCCPHDKGQCSCRKPAPGMLLRMGEKHNIDLNASWMVGDRATDIQAGARAGCRTILVSSLRIRPRPAAQVSSMKMLARKIAGIISA